MEVSLYYVDDILLATNDLGLLQMMKIFLFKNLEMKAMGETFYVIGIEISCDRSQGLLGLSQKSCINKVLERLKMEKCSTNVIPIQKGDKFSLMQCLKNELKCIEMAKIPYAFATKSLMCAQTCTR